MTNFKDPIAPKKPKKHINMWNFDQPEYDQRSSCFMQAGTCYGTGFNQPVGREGAPKQRAEVLPFGRPKTMRTDRVYKFENTNLDIED